MPTAAFFDLDKTILARSSALAFAGPLHRAGLIGRRDLIRSAVAQLSLVTGRIDHEAMERIRERLSVVVAGWDVAVLGRVIEEHLDSVVAALVFTEALDLISAHRCAGDRLVIVTSTGAEMAEPIALILGVQDVLATRMATESTGGGTHYTGEITDYMYGPRKAEAIAEYARMHDVDLSASAAYSDSGTDLPMLELVGHPHAVNPDRALRRVAELRGWPIHDFARTGSRAGTSGSPRWPTVPVAVAGVGIGAGLLGFAAASTMIRSRRRRASRP